MGAELCCCPSTKPVTNSTVQGSKANLANPNPPFKEPCKPE